MSINDIYFREMCKYDDFAEVEGIQRDAWGMPELEIVPKRLMYATVCSGGVAIGAFLDSKMIGYCWGWVGRKNDQVFIYSHHNAVRRQYQNRGIGYVLKLKQREWALDHGFELITWTFDPLLSRNSYLNLHKLGAICRTYYVNHWGEMHDELNIGLQTDRFYVEWQLDTEHVKKHLSREFDDYSSLISKPEHNAIEVTVEEGKSTIKEVRLDLKEPTILVQIPTNFLELSRTDSQWANEWRMKTREVFQYYFKKGYCVTDFMLLKAEEMKGYHVLSLKKF